MPEGTMQSFNPSLFRWPSLCLLAWVAGCSPTVPVPASSLALAAPAQRPAGFFVVVCPAGYVRIEPGTFTMGTEEENPENDEEDHENNEEDHENNEEGGEDDEGYYLDEEEGRFNDESKHSVTITRAYCMKETEVTQGEWQAVMGSNQSHFTDCGENCPVEQVSWEDAVGYANALSRREGLPECYTPESTFTGLGCRGYRLPTEAEWEYAARAGTTEGDLLPTEWEWKWAGTTGATSGKLADVAWFDENTNQTTRPVRQKLPNAWGLYDMRGNVWEWTGDWYDTYPGTVTDPTGPALGSGRVFRGGSYDGHARCARTANRRYDAPDIRVSSLGFRLAKSWIAIRGCATLPANATAGVEASNASGWGACEATACSASYHVESGACVSDIRPCSRLPVNTTAGTQSWTGSGYGSCMATTCLPDNSVVAGTCICSLGAACNGLFGAPCAANAECASGFCATGPDGTANDRCAPEAMTYIPAGTFRMGSPPGEVGRADWPDETQHTVTLSRSFFMGQTEVTQAQWKALSGGVNPSYFQSTTGTAQTTSNANDSGPAQQIDWYAAVGFANAKSAAKGLTSCYTLTGCTDAADGWRDGIHSGCTGAAFVGLTCTGYRLPTESEWEYAARGGTTTATYGGNLSATTGCVTLSGAGGFAAGTALSSLAWYDCNAADRTQAVGGKSANSFGLSDMLGSVWEWTGDWRDPSYPGTVTDPTGPARGHLRVFRGGSWTGYARDARAANRSGDKPDFHYYHLGFRLARTVP
jgi:formylglycine-generating enzyme required for sulfatase activity